MRPDGRPDNPRRPEQARVFFALWPDDTVRAALHRAALDGVRRFGGRAMRPETLHLTLAFIGDVPLDRLPILHDAAAGLDCRAFGMTLDCLGLWEHNRILWAGSSQGNDGLSELANRLAENLRAAGWPTGMRTGRPFSPHVTLVRNVGLKPPKLPELPLLSWGCERFVLVRSRLSGSGAAYEILGDWALH